jgi:hypothetical protein
VGEEVASPAPLEVLDEGPATRNKALPEIWGAVGVVFFRASGVNADESVTK